MFSAVRVKAEESVEFWVYDTTERYVSKTWAEAEESVEFWAYDTTERYVSKTWAEAEETIALRVYNKYRAAQSDDSSPIDEIYAWFTLKIKPRLTREAKEQRVNIMAALHMTGKELLTLCFFLFVKTVGPAAFAPCQASSTTPRRNFLHLGTRRRWMVM
jgi:hypothetical protein